MRQVALVKKIARTQSSALPPPAAVCKPRASLFSMIALFLGVAAALTGNVLSAQTIEQGPARDSSWKGAWSLATPESRGFDSAMLNRVASEIGAMEGVYSFLFIGGGDLLVERYFREGTRDKPHNLKSAGKSLISVLTGIAIDKGYVYLDQPIAELLSAAKDIEPAKGAITVRQLLDMTSGLESTSYGGYNRWVTSENWVEAALSLPLVAEPGTFYQYSTGNTHLLSAIITAASGMSTLDFGNKYLFGPMDITVYDWQRDPQGIYVGGNNLLMTPRDMAKIGLLFLEDGKWGDTQLVSAEWIKRSTQSHNYSGKHDNYGTHSNLWWADQKSSDFAAVGFGGQYIYVSPDCACVVVVTSTLHSKGDDWTARLFHTIRSEILGRPDTANVLLAASDGEIDPAEEVVMLRHSLKRVRLELSDLARQLGEELDAEPQFKTTTRVNFRAGPSRNADLLGILERSVPLDVIAVEEQWLQVKVGLREGWLHADYVGPAANQANFETELASLRRGIDNVLREKSPNPDVAPRSSSSAVIANEVELRTLNEKLQRLEADLKEARIVRQQLAEELSALAKVASDANAERDSASKARQSAELQLAELASELDAAEDQITILRQRQPELQAAQSDRQRLSDELQEARARAATLGDSLKEAENRLVAARLKNSALAADRTSQDDALRKLRLEGEALARQFEQLQARAENSLAEAEAEKAKSAALELSLAESRNELAALSQDLSGEQEARENAVREAVGLAAALEENERQRRLLSEVSIDLEQQLNQRESATAALASERAALEEKLAAANRARVERQAEQQALQQARLEQADNALAESMRDLAALTNAAADRQRQLEELIEKNNQLTDELAAAELNRETLMAELETARQSAQDSETKVSTFEMQLAALEGRQREAEEQSVGLERERDTARSELAALRRSMASLQSSLASNDSTLAELRSELEEQTAATGQAEAARAAAASRLAGYESDIASITETLQRAQSESAALANERATLAQELAASERDQNEQQARQLAKLEEAEAALAESKRDRAMLQAVSSERQQQLEQLLENNGRLTDELAAAKENKATLLAELENARKSSEDSKNKVSAFETQLAAMENRRLEAEGRSIDLALERDTARSELTSLRASTGALQATLASSESALAALNNELAETKAAADRAQAAREASENELARYESEVASITAALERTQSEKAALNDGLAQARERVAMLESSLAEAQGGSEELQAARAKELEALEVERKGLEAQLAQANREQVEQQVEQRARLEQAAAALQQSERERTTLSSDMALRQQQLEELLENNDRLSDELAAGAADRQSLMAELAAARGAIQQAQSNDAEAELARLRREAAASDAARDEMLAEARSAASAKPAESVAAPPSSTPGDMPDQLVLPSAGALPPSPVNVKSTQVTEIENAIRSWSNAWANQDVSLYLDAYAESFVPENRQPVENWRATRRLRLTRPTFIEVSISNLEINSDSDIAVAEFLQLYRSNTYSDRTTKQLELRKTPTGWKIIRERSL
ncbi:MAG: serine hydrolase [Gammaproteobacteria bacterium]|nr:serine hydrolase [Gammaproteobacteria bacterium]